MISAKEQVSDETSLVTGYSIIKAYLEPEDVELMEQKASSLRDRLLIRLLFRLGCRVSEALALKVSDIDFNQGSIRILHLKRRIRMMCPDCRGQLGKMHQFCPVCGKHVVDLIKRQQEHRRIRTLPIDDNTLTLVKRYVIQNQSYTHNGVDNIFRFNRHRAWQIVRDCARQAGLQGLVNPETGELRGVSPHRLRDAFGVHAMKTNDSGDGLRLLQEHLGHASFNTTAKYRKIAGDEHREWYNRLWNRV